MQEKSYIENRIYYHDTDAGGVVYYATYFEHLEEGRFQYCYSRGIDLGKYIEKGIVFPVVHVSVEYKAPARYGDLVRIYTSVEKVGDSSVHFLQEIKRADTLLVKAKTVWACIGPDHKTRAVPDETRRALTA